MLDKLDIIEIVIFWPSEIAQWAKIPASKAESQSSSPEPTSEKERPDSS